MSDDFAAAGPRGADADLFTLAARFRRVTQQIEVAEREARARPADPRASSALDSRPPGAQSGFGEKAGNPYAYAPDASAPDNRAADRRRDALERQQAQLAEAILLAPAPSLEAALVKIEAAADWFRPELTEDEPEPVTHDALRALVAIADDLAALGYSLAAATRSDDRRDPDAQLAALAARLDPIEREWKEALGRGESRLRCDTLRGRGLMAALKINAIAPSTLRGVKAKARAVRFVFAGEPLDEGGTLTLLESIVGWIEAQPESIFSGVRAC